MLIDFLKEKKSELLSAWRDMIVNSYHPDARRFLIAEKDRFSNPVGACIRTETENLLTGLLENSNLTDLRESLENFIRIRSVQDFSASQAANLMYLLKLVIREACSEKYGDADLLKELLELEVKIDGLTFMAFDSYMKCREEISRIRVNEVKKHSAVLFEKWQNIKYKSEKNNDPNDGGV